MLEYPLILYQYAQSCCNSMMEPFLLKENSPELNLTKSFYSQDRKLDKNALILKQEWQNRVIFYPTIVLLVSQIIGNRYLNKRFDFHVLKAMKNYFTKKNAIMKLEPENKDYIRFYKKFEEHLKADHSKEELYNVIKLDVGKTVGGNVLMAGFLPAIGTLLYGLYDMKSKLIEECNRANDDEVKPGVTIRRYHYKHYRPSYTGEAKKQNML